MGPFIREKPTYDTAEKSLWFRLKRNPVTSTSFLPPEHLCLQLSPNTHICTDSQSLESFNVPNTGGGGREWRAFLRKLSSGREGKKAAGTAFLSPASAHGPPALKPRLCFTQFSGWGHCQSMPLALRSGPIESHGERWMGLNNLCCCKLVLVSAFSDCTANISRKLKVPAYLGRFANKHTQLEHFY